MELEGRNALCAHLHAFGCHCNTFHVVMLKMFTVPPRRYHDNLSRAAAKMTPNATRMKSKTVTFTSRPCECLSEDSSLGAAAIVPPTQC